MEKRNFVNKTINNIVKSEDGSIITNSKAILEESRHFYMALYSKREIDHSVNMKNIFETANV